MEINHVLIVEDDKEIREGVQIYLQSQGYKVFQAADGIEGLEVLEREEYDDEVAREIRFSCNHVVSKIRGS